MADRVWEGTRELAQGHLRAGQRVWLVTATPVELATVTLAAALGAAGAGHRRGSADGVYTGRLVGGLLRRGQGCGRGVLEQEGLDDLVLGLPPELQQRPAMLKLISVAERGRPDLRLARGRAGLAGALISGQAARPPRWRCRPRRALARWPAENVPPGPARAHQQQRWSWSVTDPSRSSAPRGVIERGATLHDQVVQLRLDAAWPAVSSRSPPGPATRPPGIRRSPPAGREVDDPLGRQQDAPSGPDEQGVMGNEPLRAARRAPWR